MGLTFEQLVAKNNANPTLSGSIGASDTTIALTAGQGTKLPTIIKGTCTSLGTTRLANITGLASISIGDYVKNVTDGSWCIVKTVGANSFTCTPLVGGATNIWNNSDAYAKGRFVVTFVDVANTKSEQALVTTHAASADSIIVQRAYNGSSANTFSASDYVMLYVNEIQLTQTWVALAEAFSQLDSVKLNDHNYAADSGSANALVVTLSPTITAYSELNGRPITVKVAAANTTTSTINVNGLGVKTIKKEGGQTTLASGDLAVNMMAQLVYCTTLDVFCMTNPIANAPSSGGFTVTAKTADYTVVSGDSPTWFSNSGAADYITFTLPTPAIGKSYGFTTYGFFMKLARASASHIIYDWDGADMLDLLCSGGSGSNIELLAISTTEWQVVRQSGAWQMRGYICGGTSSTSSATTLTLIDRMLMVDDTITALSSSIAIPTAAYGATASSHMTKGFIFGGIRTDDNSYNVINELVYGRCEVCRLHQKTMATHRSWSSCVTSYVNQKSYLCGGYGAPAANTNIISKWPWGQEVDTTIAATLTPATQLRANSAWSATKGYIYSGDSNSTGEDRLLYSAETQSAGAATMTSRTARAASFQTALKSWSFGGGASLTSGDIFTFATEAKSASSASLGTGVFSTNGMSGFTKGYICGGTNVATTQAAVDNVTYSNDTRAANTSNLSAARCNATCVAPKF